MAFRPVPRKCPECGERKGWKEVINIFTTGIPLGGGVRLRLMYSRGIQWKVRYRCQKCGFTDKYMLNEDWPDLRNR